MHMKFSAAVAVIALLAALTHVGTPARADDAADLKAAEAALIAGDNAKVLALVKPLAEKGNAEAQRNMGVLYLRGRGVNRDTGAAIEWFRKSADQGFGPAQYQLGLLHYTGEGVEKNVAEAGKLFELAAAKGVIEAHHAAGRVAQDAGDLDRAGASFEQAALKGYMPAILDLTQVYEQRGQKAADAAGALADLMRAYTWVQVGLAGLESGPARDEVHRVRIRLEGELAKRQPPSGAQAIAAAKAESDKLVAAIKAEVAQREAAPAGAAPPQPAPR
jgi:hypothetical protein